MDDGKQSVSGYAATFEQPEIMCEYDGIQYKEVISRTAFEQCQMNDVVMNFNHGGKPVARTKNGTLELKTDITGLLITADLSGTEEARKLYEEIKGGYIDKMSFAFTVEDGGEEYEKGTHLRRINKIKRLYDVSAVDFPAYESTSIQARSFFEAEAERERMEIRNKIEIEKAKYFYLGGTQK
jgi:HK97 family phage prohead protease